jgi:hypothetical protein
VEAIRQQSHGAEGHACRNLNHHRHSGQPSDDHGAPFTTPDLILSKGVFMCPMV